MILKKLLLISFILFIGCSSQITSVIINDNVIPVEVAITKEQQMKGMMGRTELSGGMLFTYSTEEPRKFWMKDTLIPLDMIFINSDNVIVTIHHAAPCVTAYCEIYESLPAQYVLEVNGNVTREQNISVGTKVSFQ